MSRQGELDEMAGNLLRNYKAKTGKVPVRIIFYRGSQTCLFGQASQRFL